MEPKGFILIKKVFVATKLWPDPQVSMQPPYFIDLEAEYKKALAGKVVTVMDISVTDDGYLVLGQSKEVGPFMWMIEKKDTVNGSLLPLKWKFGYLIPTGKSLIEELLFMAETKQQENAAYFRFPPVFYFFKNKKQ
jgi:hypothetical protein